MDKNGVVTENDLRYNPSRHSDAGQFIFFEKDGTVKGVHHVMVLAHKEIEIVTSNWSYDDCKRAQQLRMHLSEPREMIEDSTEEDSTDAFNKEILEAFSRDTYAHQVAEAKVRINRSLKDLRLKLKMITPKHIQQASDKVDKLVTSIEAKSDIGSRHYVHIDMDAFYAAVEMRDDPNLRDIPMAVESDSMLSSSNYLARRFGVRAGMPGFIGGKVCPQLKIVTCDFVKYSEASKVVQAIIRKYDPNADMCMDEGNMDITDYLVTNHSSQDGKICPTAAYSLVDAIRKEIYDATKLTASAGIAPTRFLAKLCSNIKKPNGQCMVGSSKEAIREFLRATPIRTVNGIGAVMEQELHSLEIYTCRDLWNKRAIVSLLFNRATFQFLLGIAMGTGSSVFRECGVEPVDCKSLSCERTLTGTSDLNFLENVCRGLCIEIEKDLQTNSLCCKTIRLKIATTDFEVKTRTRSIMERTDSAERIFESAWKIYLTYVAEIPDLTIRLMGVRVSNFEPMTSSNAQYKIKKTLQNLSEGKETYYNRVYRRSELGITCVNVSCPICGKQFEETTAKDAKDKVDGHLEECIRRTNIQTFRENSILLAALTSLQLLHNNRSSICGKQFQGTTEKEVKKQVDGHIDECLSRSTSKQLGDEFLASTTSPPPLPKKRSATSTVVSSNAKQQKRGSDLTIDHYFKKV